MNISKHTFRYPFSERVQNLTSSDIRELMKYAIQPGFISLAGGMPNNHLFPVDEVEKIYHRLPRSEKEISFQYGPTTGYPPLIEVLKQYMESKGIPMDDHELMITTGSLQAIYIFTYLLAGEGDSILTENPSFIGSLTLFQSFGIRMRGIGLDRHGLIPEQLENQTREARITGENLKFLYIIPNFHNPAGIIYNKERRARVLDYLEREKVMLLEDDPYNELYFDEEDREMTRPILAMAPPSLRRQIVYVGSFSKILGPGFRLGWMVVPKEMYRYAELLKQSLDACSPNLSQIIANAFMRQGYMEDYLKRIRPEYKLRRDLMLRAMKTHFPPEATYVEPKGGFYIWVELPEGIDAREILERTIPEKVLFVLGKSFDPSGQSVNKFRLAFSNVDTADIEPAVRIIGNAIREVLAKK